MYHQLHARRVSVIGLFFLILSIVSFWYVESTTPARIGSLVFLLLVGTYSLYTNRPDVTASSAVFFSVFTVNQFLFDRVLPIWIGLIGTVFLILILWLSLFGKERPYFLLLICLLVAELILTVHFINLEPKFQALVVSLPFLFICQYRFFYQTT